MIYRLRKKFIIICTVSIVAVFAVMFSLICLFSAVSMNSTLDMLTDAISEGKGRFPDSFDKAPTAPPDDKGDKKPDGIINGETRFSTRHFTVDFDEEGEVVRVNTEAIHTVDEDTAEDYAEDVLEGKKARGWYKTFRYKVYRTEKGSSVTFVDASMNRAQARSFIFSAFTVLAVSFAVVLLLIIILSKRAVRPTAESYEKQKQFITDASHELKTPLTLILADLDIAETELGKSEWLDDIRAEGGRMAELVSQMVTLTRMDEGQPRLVMSRFSLSDTLLDTVSEFEALARSKGKNLDSDVAADIMTEGDEAAIRRLLSILLDNAVKYCDAGGEIKARLVSKHRSCILTVENSYAAAEQVEIGRLFDRFYRADKARTAGSGFGIGLSIAKATVTAHKGEIDAYRPDGAHIGFRVKLKQTN